MEQWEKKLEESRELHNKEIADIRAIMADNVKGMARFREESEREIAELWKLQKENEKGFAELRAQQKENKKGFAELREQQKEIAERQKEIAELQKKTDEQMKKTDEKLDRLAKNVGGINDNIGYHAEQYFQNIFDEKLSFGGQKYDYMRPNLKYGRKGVSAEFDIVLVNGTSVAIIEAKNRIHPKFIEELATEKVSQFRRYFPEYKNYKLYLGAAGFSFDGSVIEEAKKRGIGIILQVGDAIEIDDNDLKDY